MQTFPEDFMGQDVVFFTDNQSVCAALCKDASRSDDIQTFITCWHELARCLGCRVWFEWVPSKANPADELSRQATSQYIEKVENLILPAWSDRSLSLNLHEALSLVPKALP